MKIFGCTILSFPLHFINLWQNSWRIKLVP